MLYENVVASTDILSQKTALDIKEEKKKETRNSRIFLLLAVCPCSALKGKLVGGSLHAFAPHQCMAYPRILLGVRDKCLVEHTCRSLVNPSAC